MKRKIYFIVVIIALLAVNAFTLIRFRKLERLYVRNKVTDLNQRKTELDALNAFQTDLSTSILNSNFQLANIPVKDSLGNKVPLKATFSDNTKQLLVCRFSQTHCESCVDAAIQQLKVWGQSTGLKNILFLANHPNNRILRMEIPLFGIEGMNVYNAPSLEIPAEESGYPYFFILDHNLQISNVFVPDKGVPKLTNFYLEKIQKRFYQ